MAYCTSSGHGHGVRPSAPTLGAPRERSKLVRLDDLDPDDCEYAGTNNFVDCPFNHFPHAIRSASITYHRNKGWPVEHLSGRVNASPEIIKAHYDEPEDVDALARREEFMRDL